MATPTSYEYRQFHKRKLPHLHSPGATLFLTFRLAGSIPQSVIHNWVTERALLSREHKDDNALLEFRRRWFVRFEEILDRADSGPRWLANPAIAQIVADSLQYRDESLYRLHAYTIMSTHVHAAFTPKLTINSISEIEKRLPIKAMSDVPPLDVIMKSLKGYTARQANKILSRSGPFWEEESYDHEVRNEKEFHRIIRYILNNPVKAKLVKHWSDWKWNWVQPELLPYTTPRTD